MIASYIKLQLELKKTQIRNQAINGSVDTAGKPLFETTQKIYDLCKEAVELFDDCEPSPTFSGLEEIDLEATFIGIRSRLASETEYNNAKLFEFGKALNEALLELAIVQNNIRNQQRNNEDV